MTDFDRTVTSWRDIPGWFQWRDGQEEALATFGSGARFIEVGCYLGRSICSLAELIAASGHDITLLGVDTCRGSGPEGRADTDAHGPAVAHGGGTMAGLLHRNVIACGAGDLVQILVSDSVRAAALIADGSADWVHIDARHDYESVCEDIAAWAPKVRPGGWLSGDDYHDEQWPGVVAAVRDSVPDATPWSVSQWRWLKP
jgi:hypothetical protein